MRQLKKGFTFDFQIFQIFKVEKKNLDCKCLILLNEN